MPRYRVTFDRVGDHAPIEPQTYNANTAMELAAQVWQFTASLLGRRNFYVQLDDAPAVMAGTIEHGLYGRFTLTVVNPNGGEST